MTGAGSRRSARLAVLLVLLVGAAGCGERDAPGWGSRLLANRDGGSAPDVARTDVQGFVGASGDRRGSQRSLGTNDFLGASPPTELFGVSDAGEITLNLVDVPIAQAAKAVLGDALGRNYTIQPDVSGRVTLQTSRPLSERALLETFQTILELNGATLRLSDDLVTIVPLEGALKRVARVGEDGVGPRIVAVPLAFIGTAEMVRLLEPIVGASIGLQQIPRRNVLLISGTREEVNSAIEAVNLFDVDVLEGKSVGIFKLRAAEPEAVAEEVRQIFESQEGGGLENVISFTPSQRLGAILVVTSRSQYLTQAERWINDLDRTAGGTRRRPVVYNLQNRSAAELAPILSSMLEQVVAAEGGAPIEGAPKIVADDTKNAVIVWGNDTEQESFSRLVQSLDTTPVQVLLEATIAEVALNDELNFGLRWYFENARFSDASSGAVTSTFPGLSFMFQGTSAAVVINALSSITNVDVVSSPSLLVVDNEEARLQIGDEVPVATQQVREITDPAAPIVNTISFRDTGIILRVRPRVSSSGQVSMEIDQEVSSVASTTTSGIDSPTISQRRIETQVVVSDGQTIALGGLIEERRNRSQAGVPGLSKAPVIGGLFRNRKDAVGKTELLVLITPRVVRNGSEARSVTAEFRERLGQADGLIRSGIAVPTTGHRIVD